MEGEVLIIVQLPGMITIGGSREKHSSPGIRFQRVRLSVCLGIYLSIYLCIHPSTYQSINPSINPSTYQSIHPSIHLSIDDSTLGFSNEWYAYLTSLTSSDLLHACKWCASYIVHRTSYSALLIRGCCRGGTVGTREIGRWCSHPI